MDKLQDLLMSYEIDNSQDLLMLYEVARASLPPGACPGMGSPWPQIRTGKFTVLSTKVLASQVRLGNSLTIFGLCVSSLAVGPGHCEHHFIPESSEKKPLKRF